MNRAILRQTVIFLFFTALLLLSVHSPSHALEVNRSVLDNGLTVMIVERHNLPVVKVAVGIKAGSLNETAEKAGLANLTAGLLTSGTEHRTAEEISEEIEFVGGSMGASGGRDYMTASLAVLKKDIDLGFELLSDIILNPTFPEDEVSKKKERLKGSLRSMEEEPGYLASRAFKKAVFGPHPYGRLTTGTAETIDLITRKDITEFHSEFYAPNNSIMAVVGDVTTGEVEKLIHMYFSEWKKQHVTAPALPDITPRKERQLITIDRELTQANITMGHLGVSRDNPDYYALSVMNYILGGGGFSSRLMQNIREEKGLVYDIHSYFAPAKYSGRFQVGLQTKNESANTAIKEVIGEIKTIRDNPVTETELSETKSFLTGSFPMKLETTQRIARFLVAVEYYGLGLDYIDNYPAYINSVTRDDVMRAAKKYLHPDRLVIVVVGDLEKASVNKELAH